MTATIALSLTANLKFQSESEEAQMSANVETMFYVREKPWHGLGIEVKEAPASADALVYAGLDWAVEQKNVYAEDGTLISGYKVNTRSTDNATLGIVSDRYKVVQNSDAFQFTDDLLGAGVTYETAGALQGGRKVWMLARMPHRYIIAGDEIAPYLVVMNSHDGSSGIKVAMTPIRVVCQNTLNLALDRARRIWTTKHTENVMSRVHEAEETLGLAEKYMCELGRGIDTLSQIRLSDRKVMEFMQEFFPVTADLPDVQRKNNLRLLEDMKRRYWDAPDLSNMGKNGFRFVNAVSDFATHANPIRRTKNYDENLFLRTVEGNPMIDKSDVSLYDPFSSTSGCHQSMAVSPSMVTGNLKYTALTCRPSGLGSSKISMRSRTLLYSCFLTASGIEPMLSWMYRIICRAFSREARPSNSFTSLARSSRMFSSVSAI